MEETQNTSNIKQSRAPIGFGVASLVISIFSFILFRYIVISVALATISVVLGFIGYKRGDKTFAMAGLTIGSISLILTFVLFVVLNLLDTVLFYVPSWYK